MKLHALYQQACVGDAPNRRPPRFKIAERLKFDAWRKCRGMAKGDAQEAFTLLVSTLVPNWKEILDTCTISGVKPKHPRSFRVISNFSKEEMHWVPDNKSPECFKCAKKFYLLRRRHHCRICGRCHCSNCYDKTLSGQGRYALIATLNNVYLVTIYSITIC